MFPTNVQQLRSIEALRVFAALLVFFTHVTFYLDTRTTIDITVWRYGAEGVYLFFTITGFVTTISRHQYCNYAYPGMTFIISRLISVAPLYWLLITLKAFFVLVYPHVAASTFTMSSVVCAYTFLFCTQHRFPFETFYGVGWSLNIAIYYYVLFSLLAFTSSSVAITRLFCIGAMLFVLHFLGISLVAFCDIVLPFIWGIVIALIWENKRGLLSPLFVGAAFSLVVTSEYMFYNAPLGTQIKYALLLALMLSIESHFSLMPLRLLSQFGRYTYAFYLLHPVIGVALAYFFSYMYIESLFVIVPAMSFFCLVCSYVVVIYVQKPIDRMLRQKFFSYS